jgi:hypothetical protein
MSVPAGSVNANFAQLTKIVIIQVEPLFHFIFRLRHKGLLDAGRRFAFDGQKQVVCTTTIY